MVGQMQRFQIYATQGANKFENKSHNLTKRTNYHEEMIDRSRQKGLKADALAPGAEEGRGKLRNAAGRRKQSTIRRCPNEETHIR